MWTKIFIILMTLILSINLYSIDLTEIEVGVAETEKEDGNNWIGYSEELIKIILSKNNIQYFIDYYPAKRSLAYVEDGNKYYIHSSMIYREELEEKYYLSDSYQKTKAIYYFYSKKYFPEGMEIENEEDLKKYKGGGLLQHKKLSESTIKGEFTARTHKGLIKQLLAGRIDYFLSYVDVIKSQGEDIKGFDDVEYKKVKWLNEINMYFVFSKNETGKELQELFNKELNEMKINGELDILKKEYFGDEF